MSEQQSPLKSIKYVLYAAVICYFGYNLFFGGSSEGGTDYVEETLEDPTQGVIAKIQEQEKDIFRITDEEIIDNRADSRIIATFMDSSVDTFTLDEITLERVGDTRGSAMRSIAMAGMLGYMMGRPMSSGVARSAYANDKAYNKSKTGGTSQLKSTASRKTVRKPTSKGFGSGKSTRSYGG